jgi:hypothetical protein
MTPQQFEIWLDQAAKEFEQLAEKVEDQSPTMYKVYMAKALVYQSILVEFKKVKFR